MLVTGDVDLAQGFPHFIGAFDPGSGLLYSGINDDLFAIIFAVHEDKADVSTLKRLVELYYNSEALCQQMHKSSHSNDNFYTLTWRR